MADETKDYFRQPDTVTQWWFPEDPAHPLYAHFQAQQRWVLAQAPWAGQRVLDVSTGKGRFAINFARAGAQVTASASVEGYGWARRQLTDGRALCPAAAA